MGADVVDDVEEGVVKHPNDHIQRESGFPAFLGAYDEQVFGGHQRIALARCVRRGANGYDGSVGHHRTGERPVEEGGQVFASANRWVTEDDAE